MSSKIWKQVTTIQGLNRGSGVILILDVLWGGKNIVDILWFGTVQRLDISPLILTARYSIVEYTPMKFLLDSNNHFEECFFLCRGFATQLCKFEFFLRLLTLSRGRYRTSRFGRHNQGFFAPRVLSSRYTRQTNESRSAALDYLSHGHDPHFSHIFNSSNDCNFL